MSTCDKCKFFLRPSAGRNPADEVRGKCRRYPPTPIHGEYGPAFCWAVVRADASCGEFKADNACGYMFCSNSFCVLDKGHAGPHIDSDGDKGE